MHHAASPSLSRRGMLGGASALVAAGALGRAHAADAGQPLRAGITGYSVVNTLDPAAAALIPEFYVIWALFNGLLKFDARMHPVPDLAESFTTDTDGSVTFRLRPGVRFHDGSTLTADDVKFTIERLQSPDTHSPSGSNVAQISSVDILDPLTVRIRTSAPFAPLLAYLTNSRTGTQIVPRKAVTADPAGFGRKPVGTGAYGLADWQPGQSLRLRAHGDYFETGLPHLQVVDVPLIPEETSGVTALLGHQIDLTATAPFADIPSLERQPGIRVLKQPGLNTRFVTLNTRQAPFDDVHFRRAVSMAFDRNVLVNVVLFGEGVATPGLMPPSLAAAYDPTPRPLTSFNPAQARAELAKSRYGAGTKGTMLAWSSGWWKRTAEIIVAQANQVLGTQLSVEVTEANTVFSRIKAGDYQSSIWGWLGMIDPDQYSYDLLSTRGWRNFTGYSNPRLDALLVRARQTLDPAARGALYRQSESLWIEDMPVLPCFCSNIQNLLVRNAAGFTQLPYSNFGDQFATMTLG